MKSLKEIESSFWRQAGFKYRLLDKILILKRLAEIPYVLMQSSRRFKSETGKSSLWQFFSLVGAVLFLKLRAKEYYLYRLDQVSDRIFQQTFIPQACFLRWAWYLNLRSCQKIWWDKLSFFSFCLENKLTTVPILSVYEKGEKRELVPMDASCDVIVKPDNGSCGLGVERWKFHESCYQWDEKRLDSVDFESYLLNLGRQECILLQPCLVNHPEMKGLNNGGLATVRCSTFKNAEGGAEAIMPVLRMPCGVSIVDNFQRDNLVAPIDLDSGKLGPAYRKIDGVVVEVLRHPDTGCVIEGERLPFWRELIALCLDAQKCCKEEQFVGWDVAITLEGPVLIEANLSFGIEAIQVAHSLGLGSTPFINRLDSLLQEPQGKG